MISGFVVCAAWQQLGLSTIVISGAPAMLVSMVLAIVVSLLTKQPYEKEIEEEIKRAARDI